MPPVDLTPIGQGFAANDSYADRRNALYVELGKICPIADGTAREIMEAIELLARRIAIDMLASKEFSERIHIAQKAFIFELTQTQEFKSAVGEIASNMIGQNVPELLECNEFQVAVAEKFDEMFEYAFERRFVAASESDRFNAKIMDIAWPEMTAPQRDDLIGVIRQAQQHRESIYESAFLESDTFETKIRQIVDERMTSNLKETIKVQCDHEWVDEGNKVIAPGVQWCRKCKAVRDENGNVFQQFPSPAAERHPDAQIIAPPITEPEPACDHQWEDTPTADAGVRKYCRRCGAFRPIRPTDVKEEIIEIDPEGNVSAVESTVHTKPTLDHSQISDRPCDVPDE